MKEGAKFLGHHIHPVLIVFPLGLLATGTVFDVIYQIRGGQSAAIVAYWMIVAGIVGGVVAALFGLIDWLAIDSGTRAKRIGLIHGLVNVAVVAIFVLSWFLRYGDPWHPARAATAVSVIAAALSAVGGWLGGELVERLSIGVHPGANPDAPNSLFSDNPKSVKTPL